MEKKEPIKISLPVFITIIVLLVAIVCGFYMYMQNEKLEEEIANLRNEMNQTQVEKNELQEKLNSISNITQNSSATTTNTQTASEENKIKLNEGTYKTDEEIDPSDGEGISEIKLEDNKFVAHLFYGGFYNGTYTIKDNILICNANEEVINEGGYSKKNTNAVFEFKIINNNKIEFITNKNMSSEYDINKGFVYNRK